MPTTQESVTKCLQHMHHEGDNVVYVDKITITGPEILLCHVESHGLNTLYCSSRSEELEKPYIVGYMVPHTYSKWADWFPKFLPSDEVWKQKNVHKREAMLSHGRQESHKWKANSIPIPLHGHMHTPACVAVSSSSSYFVPIREMCSFRTRWLGCIQSFCAHSTPNCE